MPRRKRASRDHGEEGQFWQRVWESEALEQRCALQGVRLLEPLGGGRGPQSSLLACHLT